MDEAVHRTGLGTLDLDTARSVLRHRATLPAAIVVDAVVEFGNHRAVMSADDIDTIERTLAGTGALSDRKRTTPHIVRPGDGRRTHCANTPRPQSDRTAA